MFLILSPIIAESYPHVNTHPASWLGLQLQDPCWYKKWRKSADHQLSNSLRAPGAQTAAPLCQMTGGLFPEFGTFGVCKLRQLHPGQWALVQGPWSFVQVCRITEFGSLRPLKKLYGPPPGVRN